MTSLEFSYSINGFYPKLKSFAFKLTRDIEDAEDLIQETLLKALSNREKFADGTNLKAWIYTIMKNTFITNYQRITRRKTFIDNSDNLYYINSSYMATENEGLRKFVAADLKKAIQSLEETYKTPFEMFFTGFKYHEIAERLAIPIGTVKNRIHIARKELKEKLSSYAQ